MAKYEDVELITDDLYEATIVPETFWEKLKLAYMIVVHSDKIRCKLLVNRDWFEKKVRETYDE